MNICILTGKIIYCNQLLKLKNRTLSQAIIAIPNNKKKISYYKIKGIAKSKCANRLLEISAINNLCIIECFIYIKKSRMFQQNIKINKVRKNIHVKIFKIHNLL